MYLKKRLLIPLFCFFLSLNAFSQSIGPATLNVGGGSFNNSSLKLEWSIGEATVVESFQIGSNYFITNGVLQPYTASTLTSNNANTLWAMGDLSIFPVPTQSIVNINFLSSLKGKVRMELLDDMMRLLATQEFTYYSTNGIKNWNLSKYASGTYFLKISLVANNQSIIKQGSFKIQKIN